VALKTKPNHSAEARGKFENLYLSSRLLLHSDSIYCYKRQTIEYTIHNDELNELNTFT
jgi:hypothetical protein